MFTPRITGSQGANARNQQISEPCNLQIKRKISKLNKIKQTKKGNFQQSWNVTMHQIALEELPGTTCTSERASTSRCYNFLPPDLSLSLYLSQKKNGKAPCTSGSTCLQTVPHRPKTKLQATLTTTRITPLQFSKWAMKKQTKKTEENNARALPEKFCRKNTPMWVEMQTQTIPMRETMRSQWSGILERRSREMEARQRSAGREREASRQRKGRAKKKPRQFKLGTLRAESARGKRSLSMLTHFIALSSGIREVLREFPEFQYRSQ